MGLSEKWAFPILNWNQQSSEDTIPKHPEVKLNIQKNNLYTSKYPDLEVDPLRK